MLGHRQPLFDINIKAGNLKMNLPIYEIDNETTLLQRLKIKYPYFINSGQGLQKQKLKNKIFQSLKNILNCNGISQKLKIKVQEFLRKFSWDLQGGQLEIKQKNVLRELKQDNFCSVVRIKDNENSENQIKSIKIIQNFQSNNINEIDNKNKLNNKNQSNKNRSRSRSQNTRRSLQFTKLYKIKKNIFGEVQDNKDKQNFNRTQRLSVPKFNDKDKDEENKGNDENKEKSKSKQRSNRNNKKNKKKNNMNLTMTSNRGSNKEFKNLFNKTNNKKSNEKFISKSKSKSKNKNKSRIGIPKSFQSLIIERIQHKLQKYNPKNPNKNPITQPNNNTHNQQTSERQINMTDMTQAYNETSQPNLNLNNTQRSTISIRNRYHYNHNQIINQRKLSQRKLEKNSLNKDHDHSTTKQKENCNKGSKIHIKKSSNCVYNYNYSNQKSQMIYQLQQSLGQLRRNYYRVDSSGQVGYIVDNFNSNNDNKYIKPMPTRHKYKYSYNLDQFQDISKSKYQRQIKQEINRYGRSSVLLKKQNIFSDNNNNMKNFNTNRDFIIKTDRNTNAEVNSYNNPKANANACDGKFQANSKIQCFNSGRLSSYDSRGESREKKFRYL